MSRKVRAGARYQYRPVLIDQCSPKARAVPGEVVRVVNLHGCPPANTMGHAHIEGLSGEFLGLVCTNSLQPLNLFPAWYWRVIYTDARGQQSGEWTDVKTAKGAMERLRRLHPEAKEWEVARDASRWL